MCYIYIYGYLILNDNHIFFEWITKAAFLNNSESALGK